MENLGRGEISSNARIQEWTEELRIYYERILNHESLRDMSFELLLTVWLIAGPHGIHSIFGRHLDSVLHFNFGLHLISSSKTLNLFMSSCTLFWDENLSLFTFLTGKLRKTLFWTNKKFVYLLYQIFVPK